MARRAAIAVLVVAAAAGAAPASAAAITAKPTLQTANEAIRLVVVLRSSHRFTRRTRPRGVRVVVGAERWTLRQRFTKRTRSVWRTRNVRGAKAAALFELAGRRIVVEVRTVAGKARLRPRVPALGGVPPPAAPPKIPEPAPGPPPGGEPGPSKAEQALAVARRYVGTPFVWGGADPAIGFDSPGLTQYCYRQAGIELPRLADQQFLAGTATQRTALRPGDLVFFQDTTGYVDHVGIFAGGSGFIHAPSVGDVVKVSSLDEPYYNARFAGARHIAD